MEETLTDVN